MVRRRTGPLCLLLTAAACTVSGQAGEAAWVLGVSALPAAPEEGAAPVHAAGLEQLPLLVIGNLRDMDLRFTPEEEAASRRERSRLEGLYEAGAEDAALRDRRDAAFLAPGGIQERAADTRELAGQYERSRKQSEPPGDGRDSPAAVSIRLWEGHAAGRLLEGTADPAGACVREKLDYLVLWDVREISGYLRIRMDGWNAALGRPDASYTAYCPADDASSAAEELARALIRAAVARPSSRLVFEVEPAEVRILVDGRMLAPGRRSLRVYEEREYAVTVELGEEVRKDYPLRSEFGQDVRLSVRLERPAASEVVVATDPPGASLYLDGIWAGATPAAAGVFDSPRVARLALSGYEDEYAVIGPETPELLELPLREREEGPESAFDRAKDRFYAALGRLVVSLPVSLLAYGMYLQSADLHRGDPGNDSFTRRYDVSLAAFAVSSGITAVFLASSSVRLVRYIHSAR